MKALLVCVFMLIAIQVIYCQCNKYTCTGIGDRCDTGGCTKNADGVCDRFCRAGASCVGTPGEEVCTVSGEGAACSNSLHAPVPCSGSNSDMLSYSCVMDRCVPLVTSLLDNDECESSTNCEGGLACKDGKCRGVENGERCDSDLDCQVLSFCNMTVRECAVLPGGDGAPGSSCLVDSQCRYGSCVDNSCVAYASAQEGDKCTVTRDCGANLFCDFFSNFTCRSYEASSMAPCNPLNISSCERSYESCQCNHKSGESVCVTRRFYAETRCAEERKKQIACAKDNKCKEGSPVGVTGSCMRKNCLEVAKQLRNCFRKGNNELLDKSCHFSSSPALTALLAGLF